MSMSIKKGFYRHYKGNEYLVLNVAQHSESGETLVVYQPQYGERNWWVRPLDMFLESVTVAGQSVPRFAWLRDAD